MKHLLLSITIIYSINCLSQSPNPNLFQTWYLYSVMASDSSPGAYIVSEVEPTITPSLTIFEDFTFNGIGACNTFNGIFKLPNSNVLETEQFSKTTNDCGVEIHNELENEYFNTIQILSSFSISSIDNSVVLTIETPIFGRAVFKNTPLSVTKLDLQQIEIYPNPTNSLIHLKSPKNPILKIEIFNSLGQSIKRVKNNFDTINIFDLPNGLYIIKIDTEFGTAHKKIIKE